MSRIAIVMILAMMFSGCWTYHVGYTQKELIVEKKQVGTQERKSTKLDHKWASEKNGIIEIQARDIVKGYKVYRCKYRKQEIREYYSPFLELIEIPMAIIGPLITTPVVAVIHIAGTPLFNMFYYGPTAAFGDKKYKKYLGLKIKETAKYYDPAFSLMPFASKLSIGLGVALFTVDTKDMETIGSGR